MTDWSEAINAAGELPDYLYIDGHRVQDASLDSIDSYDPASGLLLTSVPAGNSTSIDEAVEFFPLAPDFFLASNPRRRER